MAGNYKDPINTAARTIFLVIAAIGLVVGLGIASIQDGAETGSTLLSPGGPGLVSGDQSTEVLAGRLETTSTAVVTSTTTPPATTGSTPTTGTTTTTAAATTTTVPAGLPTPVTTTTRPRSTTTSPPIGLPPPVTTTTVAPTTTTTSLPIGLPPPVTTTTLAPTTTTTTTTTLPPTTTTTLPPTTTTTTTTTTLPPTPTTTTTTTTTTLPPTTTTTTTTLPPTTTTTVADPPVVWVHGLSGSSNCCEGPEWFADVEVDLKATQNWDLSGAVVTGQWAGAYNAIVSAATDDDGEVDFVTPGILVDAAVTFTVLDVSDPVAVYDPGKNRTSSVSIPSPL